MFFLHGRMNKDATKKIPTNKTKSCFLCRLYVPVQVSVLCIFMFVNFYFSLEEFLLVKLKAPTQFLFPFFLKNQCKQIQLEK